MSKASPASMVKEAPAHLPIRAWPEGERPQERLLARGAQALSDAELLALLLRTGGRGQSAVELARQVQARAEQAGGLAALGAGGLMRLPGLGPAKAALLLAAVELGRRSACTPVSPGERILTSRQAYEACRAELEACPQESLLVLALDAKHRLLGRKTVSLGTLTQSLVHPREVFRPALEWNAAAVLVAHNHPSGDPQPSAEDHQVTRRLRQAAALLGLGLLDHLVVGKGIYFSYADRAWTIDGTRLGD
jgi:DNA repair protein RadC